MERGWSERGGKGEEGEEGRVERESEVRGKRVRREG